MKTIRLAALAVFVVSVLPAANPVHVAQKSPLRLTADLTIGVDDGDENLIFKSVTRIDLDKDGRIYMVDYKDSKIRIFDTTGKFLKVIPIPVGQGPAELSHIAGMAVSPNGLVFLNEMRKVVVYDPDGIFIRSFPLDFNATTIGNAGDENVIVLGLNGGKMFHVYGAEGKLIRSFADPFEVPASLSEYKDMPTLKAPILFSTSKAGRIYILNPHRYEVSIYLDYKLIGILKGKSDYFEKAKAMGRGVILPAAYIQDGGKRVYVMIWNPAAKSRQEMDVFEDGLQTSRIPVSGKPFATDANARLYIAEEEGYPRIVRYVVER